MMTYHLPILIISSYLIAAFISLVLSKFRPKLVGTLIRTVVFFSLVGTIVLLRYINETGDYIYYMGNWEAPWGIALSVDSLSLFMALAINALSLLVLVFAKADLKHEIDTKLEPWYYALFSLLVGAMIGLSFSNDFFNIFVFTEITTIAACGIISIKAYRDCVEASLKYLILSTLGSGLILFAIALVYMVTGHLNLDFIARELPNALEIYPMNILVSLTLLIVGFGIKSALFPLHVWLPDAHSSAATPSSAILSGVVVKVYAVVLLRLIFKVYGLEIFNVLPIAQILLALATLAIFAGSLFAINQRDIKRMLAYSSVAQMGYIFLGIALTTENGVTGGILHIVNHGITKVTLFLAAGAIIYKTGIRNIDELEGIGYRMPITMSVFSIGAMSMIGLPGFNGFISKFYLAIGALDAHNVFLVAVILMSSLLNAVYYLPIVVKAFFGPQEHRSFSNDGLPRHMMIPLIILGSAIVYFGLLPGSLLALVRQATGVILGS